YHELRYNKSLTSPCHDNECTHLCLLVPGGHRCSCPDSAVPSSHRTKAEIKCDAAQERPRPDPRICLCQNGGLCRETDSNELECECPPDFQGQYCDIHAAQSRADAASNTIAIVVPIVILLLLGSAAGICEIPE
ncbi:Low-density lipoprotein receptor-related protein 2-like protein, partial [Tribolium castaneum]